MSEMVERVALACHANATEKDWSIQTTEQMWDKVARAAIAAMREPTINMRRVARLSENVDRSFEDDAVSAYQAMIDEALK